MRLSIFARLIISYLMLFTLLAGVSLYFIYHLDQFNKVIRSVVLNDTMALDYSNRLSDALLSQFRNDRKFAVLKDEALYQSALAAGEEFGYLLNETLSRTSTEELRWFYTRIRSQHQDFSQLVEKEKELISLAEPYPAERYADEKKKAAENIIRQLKQIKVTSEKNAFGKIENLNQKSEGARNISIIISVISLSVGLLVTFVITRSIKKPLDAMRVRTVEISRGNLQDDLVVKSPPELVQLAAALNTMCHKLQEVDDIKSHFFSHVSHELRTPLTSIKVGTEMLLEGLGGDLTEKQQQILSIVIKESNRLIELVNTLLDLSKMEAGMLKYQYTSTDLATLVSKTLDTLAPLFEEKNISLINKIGPLKPVRADQERILQVLHNIIGNAVKFTPKNGTINLEAQLRDDAVEVAVHDTGPGIPEEHLERIFLKFQQVNSTTEESTKGTGLGLATVKQIILAHGGKVWATSRLGKGTTLHITLPLAA